MSYERTDASVPAAPLLRPYQADGVSFLLGHDSALLGDEMGLGKTIQAIAAIDKLARDPKFRTCLVVAPASLLTNWARELLLWAPGVSVFKVHGDSEDRRVAYRFPVQVLLASYDHVRADMVALPAREFDIVVLDEAQRIKNLDSRTALACRLLQRHRSWALTGTPLENHPRELSSVFRFLKPGTIGPHMPHRQMRELIRPYVLRRRVADVLADLPSKIEHTVLIDLTKPQRQAYAMALDEYSSQSDRSSASALALITKLKQICNYDVSSGASAKLDIIRDILLEARREQKKVLIFSQYVNALFWLGKRLDVEPLFYHGGLTEAEKEAAVAAFSADTQPSVMLISLRAGAVGLNLQAASVVVLLDRWWNPAIEEQAIARAYRSGQSKVVTAYKFLTARSIEERIETVLRDKGKLFDLVVNSLSESDGTGMAVQRLAAEELAAFRT